MSEPQNTNIQGIPAEYVLAKQVVVFSHGFGVGRDDRGLFTDLADNLPEDVGYVLFDYNTEKDGNMLIASPSEQAKKLAAIVDWAKRQEGVLDVSIIAHSMGGVSVALAKPAGLHKLIMLAVPVAISKRTREYFTNRPGAVKQGDSWLIPRRDGTNSIIPETLFSEFGSLDPSKLLSDYAKLQNFSIIAAGEDEVLKDIDYTTLASGGNIACEEIAKASHNFEGSARKELRKRVNDILLESRKKVDKGYGGGGYNA